MKSSATIVTSGDFAAAVEAQSIGGGGGKYVGPAGLPFSTIGLGGFGIAGSGAPAGSGGAVEIDNAGAIATSGAGSIGLMAQSIGGGGGDGASAVGLGFLTTPTGFGGKGGAAGNGGGVTINNASAGAITTTGASAYAIFAQSVGAGGGLGGKGDGLSLLGAGSGANGTGGAVNVTNAGMATTGGLNAIGILAQSIGGGGATVGAINGDLALAGAGSGGDAAAVAVTNSGAIGTSGALAAAILAQSIGGGGGLATESSASAQTITFGASKGGGNGGAITVANSAILQTTGFASPGIIAQSVSGGGGLVFTSGGANTFAGNSGSTSGTAGNVQVTDSGRILTTGDHSPGILAQSVAGGGGLAGLFDPAQNALGSGLAGFAGSAGGAGTAGLVNVLEQGTVVTKGVLSPGIFAQSFGGTGGVTGRAVTVEVAGTVFASDPSSDGVNVQSLSFSQAAGGTLTVTIDAGGSVTGGAGVKFTGGANNILNNNGTLTANSGPTDFAADGGTMPLTINNAGTMSGSIGGTGASPIVVNNMASGLMNTGVTVALGAGGSFTNNGTVSPFGAGVVGTTAVTGPYTQGAGGTLLIDLDGGNVRSDLLQISGKASVAGTLFINPINFSNVKPGDGDVTVLTASGGLTTGSITLARAPSSLISISIDSITDTSIVIGYGVDFAPDSFGTYGNRYNVGRAFDAIQAAGLSAKFATITPSLFAVPTDAALASLYDGLSGEGATGMQQTAFAADDMFLTTVNQQIDAWRRGATAGAPRTADGFRIWSSAYRSFGSLTGNMTDGSGKMNYGGGGLALGVDRAFDGGFLIGAALGGDVSNYSVATRGAWGQLSGGRFAAYGAWHFAGLYAAGIMGGASYGVDESRTFNALVSQEKVQGHASAFDANGRVEAGYRLGLGTFGVTGFAALQMSNFRSAAFTEGTVLGADFFPLAYASHRTWSRLREFGVQLETESLQTALGAFSVAARASLRHESSTRRWLTPTFYEYAGATPFAVDGARAAADRRRVGVDINLAVTPAVTMFASGSGEFGGGSSSGSVRAGLRAAW